MFFAFDVLTDGVLRSFLLKALDEEDAYRRIREKFGSNAVLGSICPLSEEDVQPFLELSGLEVGAFVEL